MVYRTRRTLTRLGTAAVAATLGASVLVQAGTASAAVDASAVRYLHRGSYGPAVTALQHRLTALHYFVGKIDGRFGWDTLEGVWAFKEVQSGKIRPRNPNIVGPAMQQQLLHPKLPKVLHPNGGRYLRIEINKKIEVLVLYNHQKIELITHVSTGGGYYYCSNGGCGYAVTPDGHYKALSFLRGNITVPLGTMYNPVFFIGRAYAIHGEPNGGVPLYPASHGCVRIPWDLAKSFHKLIKIVSIDGRGTPIWISG